MRVGNRPFSTEGEIRTSLFKPERRAGSQQDGFKLSNQSCTLNQLYPIPVFLGYPRMPLPSEPMLAGLTKPTDGLASVREFSSIT